MKQITFFLLVFIVFFSTPCFSEENVVVHWLNKIGAGENIDEPVCPYVLPSMKIAKYIQELPRPEPISFLNFMSIIDARDYPYGQTPGGVCPNTTTIPFETIARVLNRRTPVINFFQYDKEIVEETVSPRLTYKIGSTYSYAYLGMIQICLIQMLIEANDDRFEEEAKDLLDYWSVSLFPYRNVFNYKKMQEIDARITDSSSTINHLPRVLISYLNVFRKKRDEKVLKENLSQSEIREEFEFGKTCSYYDLGKWRAYIDPIPEELLKSGNFCIDDPRLEFLYADRIAELRKKHDEFHKEQKNK